MTMEQRRIKRREWSKKREQWFHLTDPRSGVTLRVKDPSGQGQVVWAKFRIKHPYTADALTIIKASNE